MWQEMKQNGTQYGCHQQRIPKQNALMEISHQINAYLCISSQTNNALRLYMYVLLEMIIIDVHPSAHLQNTTKFKMASNMTTI